MKSVEYEKIIFTNNNKYISINIFGEFTIFFPKNKAKKVIHNNKKMLQMRNNLTGVKTISMTIKKFNGKTQNIIGQISLALVIKPTSNFRKR